PVRPAARLAPQRRGHKVQCSGSCINNTPEKLCGEFILSLPQNGKMWYTKYISAQMEWAAKQTMEHSGWPTGRKNPT
ncbi:MAG: hypothetical protein WBO79_07060, partial [Gemmiger qucibialis]